MNSHPFIGLSGISVKYQFIGSFPHYEIWTLYGGKQGGFKVHAGWFGYWEIRGLKYCCFISFLVWLWFKIFHWYGFFSNVIFLISFGRVSVPCSVLLPAHRHRPHRNSFDPSNSLGLSSVSRPLPIQGQPPSEFLETQHYIANFESCIVKVYAEIPAAHLHTSIS